MTSIVEGSPQCLYWWNLLDRRHFFTDTNCTQKPLYNLLIFQKQPLSLFVYEKRSKLNPNKHTRLFNLFSFSYIIYVHKLRLLIVLIIRIRSQIRITAQVFLGTIRRNINSNPKNKSGIWQLIMFFQLFPQIKVFYFIFF